MAYWFLSSWDCLHEVYQNSHVCDMVKMRLIVLKPHSRLLDEKLITKSISKIKSMLGWASLCCWKITSQSEDECIKWWYFTFMSFLVVEIWISQLDDHVYVSQGGFEIISYGFNILDTIVWILKILMVVVYYCHSFKYLIIKRFKSLTFIIVFIFF